MVEKIGTVKNPLTIIAIFAGVSEISGTAVLPFVAKEFQATFIWFLMGFPVLLVVLFFAVLLFKHRVLYAPSDFRDEDNFFRNLPTATYAEKALQVEAEAKSEGLEAQTTEETRPAKRSYQEVYAMAENLVFESLRHQFTAIRREIKAGERIIDGVAHGREGTTVIEIKVLRKGSEHAKRIREALWNMQDSIQYLGILGVPPLRLLLFLVLAGDDIDAAPIKKSAEAAAVSMSSKSGVPVEVRVERFSDLEGLYSR